MMRKGRWLSLLTSGGKGGREEVIVTQTSKGHQNELNGVSAGVKLMSEHTLRAICRELTVYLQ